jgi:REP element-mobilizing transposase RayT
MSRGDRQEPIFQDDQDREGFLATLAEACGKTGWEVQALCLLGNHFHLVVETPQVKTEILVQEEMKRLKWGEAELGRRVKGDVGKVALAVRLRQETVMTVKWIAERLQMGRADM